MVLLAGLVPGGALAAPEAPSRPGLFAQAMEALRTGNLVETARLCWSYMKGRERSQADADAGAADKAESASYYLGEALERLGYAHAAIDRYVEIVTERRAPQLVPRALAALERLAAASPHDAEAIVQEGVLTLAEFEELPPRLSSFVHYLQAVDDLRHGHDDWALRHFERISEESPYFPQALYARAVWHLGKGESDAALKDLAQVLKHEHTPARLRARALHSRARLLYEQGKWAEAYEDLDKVDLRYEAGSDILLEKAWARYRARDFRTALGLLHALGAPGYADRFTPERFLLRSLIFGKFCHFRAAKRSIDLFRQRYENEIAALKAGTRPEEIEALARASAEREPLTGVGAVRALLGELAREQAAVGRHAAWGPVKAEKGNRQPSLNQHLTELYRIKMQRARFHERQLLRAAAERVAGELLDTNEQMNLLEYEVGLGIYRRIGRDTPVLKKDQARRAAIPRISDRIYYHFDGEYWSDELRDMQFMVEDRCVD